MSRATYLLLAACCSLLTAHAEPPAFRWIVAPSRPAPADWVVFQGETITLEPSFQAYGETLPLTNCTAALYWQTNGMGQAWWSVPAEIVTGAAPRVRATWSPTNDIGARAYTYFVGLVAPGGIGYRAHGRLMMRAAPGAIPALLGPPTTLTDAMQAWADARYDLLGAAQGVSNALAGALQSEAAARAAGDAPGATALQPFWAATGTVDHATYADEAYHASVADDAGRAVELAPGVPDKVALGAATAHITDPGAHTNIWADIRADIASATNDLVQTYLITSNAWMTISNGTLTVWRSTNGVPAAIWSSAESAGGAIDPAFTNALWVALLAKADKAWGKYAPDGSTNPDPTYMTYLNAPATMHASGYQWATYGAYAVMAESGAVAYESGDDGTARWGLDLQTNYVGFVRGGSVIVASKAASIVVSAGGTTNGYVEIIYPYTSGDFPTLWYSPALAVQFAVQSGVVWVDNEDGTATVTAPATSAKGFWFATTTSTYDVMFDIRPPARLAGGVVVNTNTAPVVYDSVITVTSGAKTYRIPAQEVP